MDLRRSSKSCSTQNPSTNPFFFQLEEAWKACTLSQFRHNDAVQLRFLEKSSTRIFDRPLPTPSNLFAPSSKSSSSSPFFFFFRFQRLFRRMDSRFETRSIFNRLNFTWTPSVSLKEEDANDFVPSSRMDGRNFGGEATMMQVSDVFQWWTLPVGMVGGVILSFASRFSFLFARKAKKWTKIYRYQVSFYYL